jgi:hypothetical protein
MIRILLFIVVIVFTATGCSNSVGPIHSNGKDPSSYTWRIDTLYYTTNPQSPGQTVIYNAWGLNDSLIYAVGYDQFNGRGSMWKYDGHGWGRIKLLATEGGPLSNGITLNAIKGYASNDIYAFGYSFTNFTGSFVNTAIVLHFDGIKWNNVQIPKGNIISSVVSSTPSLVYCGGDYGQLFKYDGTTWAVDTIKQTPYPSVNLQVGVIGMSSDGGVYIQTTQYDLSKGWYYQFLKYKDKQIEMIESGTNSSSWGGYSYWQSENGNIYSSGEGGIYQLIGNKFQKYYSDAAIYSIVGTDQEPMFGVRDGSVIYHDGSTWAVIYAISDFSTKRVQSMYFSGNELFIFISDGIRSYVLHGA